MNSYRITVKRTINQTLTIQAKDKEEAKQLAGIYRELISIEEVKGEKE